MDLSQKRQLDEISESMNLPSTKSVAASGNEADEFFFVLKTCINRCLMSGNLFKCVLSPLVRIYFFSGFPRIVKSTFKTFVPIINAKVKVNENMIHRLFLKIKSKLQVEHIYSLSNEVSCFFHIEWNHDFLFSVEINVELREGNQSSKFSSSLGVIIC